MLYSVNLARSEAIKRGTEVRLVSVAGSDWSGGWNLVADTNNDSDFDDAADILMQWEALNGDGSLAIAATNSPTDTYLAFTSRGALSPSNASFIFTLEPGDCNAIDSRIIALQPSYLNQVTQFRRADAQAVLMEAAQFMERFYTENNRYDQDSGGTAVALPAPLRESPRDSGTKSYDISVQASTASTYTLRATPKNAQTGDGFLQITNTFAKGWDSDNGGSLSAAEQTWSQH
jgi:type IV pilus assembly protein PilE